MTPVLRLAHVGIHGSLNRNAGDTLLFEEVRRLVESGLGPIEWVPLQLWEPFDVDAAHRLSADVDGVVVGGGGLLLRDQDGSDTSASGWQWNVTTDAIRALDVPLFVVAIGYNRFRGHADFDPPFAESMAALAETAAFFGLRNTGSIEAVRGYVSAASSSALSLQPCPTVLARPLHPELAAVIAAGASSGETVLRLNAAFDRSGLRLGEDQDLVLGRVAAAMARAQRAGWQIRLTCHKAQDASMAEHLRRAGVGFELDDLTDSTGAEILRAYCETGVSIGMRGHSQMIPFGLGHPIVSLVSHDKMAWFLDDVGRPEWGIEMMDPDLDERLVAQVDEVAQDPRPRRTAIDHAQERFWSLTRANLAGIAGVLGRDSMLDDVREVVR